MNGVLEWSASIGAILAATLIAIDLSRRVTGYGFVLFCVVSILWIVSGIVEKAVPIAAMNLALLIVNAWGVWRYLLKEARETKGSASTSRRTDAV
ncbi:MAG: hypothetical protein WA918_06425 [Erythrobacter sp.]